MQSGNCVQNVSEVARLKQQLDAECAAAWQGLYGPAEVAKHAYITKRLENIGSLHGKLVEKIGEQKATEVLVRAMDRPVQ